MELELDGNPWRDIAGHLLKFSNPDAKPGTGSDLSAYQDGRVGDMTASRKVIRLHGTATRLCLRGYSFSQT